MEVTLQDITAGESVLAKNTHVGAITSVSQQMALEVLGVEVSLVTVRAGEFAVRVLSRDSGALSCTIDPVRNRSRAAWDTGQNATAALRADNLRPWWFLGVRGAVRAVHIRSHTPTLTIGVTKGTGRKTIEIRATVARGCRSNRLRVTLSGGCGRKDTRRWGVLLMRSRVRHHRGLGSPVDIVS